MLERTSLIIKKLQQLVDDNANADMLLTISQMLVAELQQIQNLSTQNSVSVTMPRKTIIVNEVPKQEEVLIEPKDSSFQTTQVEIEPNHQSKIPSIESNDEIIAVTGVINIETSEESSEPLEPITWFMQEQEVPETESKREDYKLELPKEIYAEPVEETIVPQVYFEQPLASTPNDYLFETTTQIPTLPDVDITAADFIPSPETVEEIKEVEVNSRFKEHKVEVAHLLENTHIKDLRKAISINDKYLFINDLFGGDESLYDRSIKQIQSYSILPEATFWIQRELKIKLNWSADNEVVQLFDQLVRRRFS